MQYKIIVGKGGGRRGRGGGRGGVYGDNTVLRSSPPPLSPPPLPCRHRLCLLRCTAWVSEGSKITMVEVHELFAKASEWSDKDAKYSCTETKGT